MLFRSLGNLFVGVGELLLAPTLMSAVAYLIDEKYQGTFMGLWPLSLALSGFFGSLIARYAVSGGADVFSSFSNAFSLMIMLMLVVMGIYVVMIPLLRALARS